MAYRDLEKKKEYFRLYRIKHREEFHAYDKKYRLKYPEKEALKSKNYRINHPEVDAKYRAKNRDKANSYAKAYRLKNGEKIKKYKTEYNATYPERGRKTKLEYYKKRMSTDIQYRLAARLRIRMHSAIGRDSKIGSAVRDLGCTIAELKNHLERRFKKGMSWGNYGKWEIDHIVPLNFFDLTDRKQFLQACNYSNLQPLWRKTNREKGAKIPTELKHDAQAGKGELTSSLDYSHYPALPLVLV